MPYYYYNLFGFLPLQLMGGVARTVARAGEGGNCPNVSRKIIIFALHVGVP